MESEKYLNQKLGQFDWVNLFRSEEIRVCRAGRAFTGRKATAIKSQGTSMQIHVAKVGAPGPLGEQVL